MAKYRYSLAPHSQQALRPWKKTELIFLPRDKLRDLFQQDPSLAMNMLAVLAQRLRNFTELIGDLALKEISQRLATYLLYMQTSQRRDDKINLAVSKGTLSKILCSTQETLSRVLKKMEHAGIIEINNKEINILDLEYIKDLSEGYSPCNSCKNL